MTDALIMLTDKLSIAILQLFPGKHQSKHCKAVTCDHEQEGEKHACRDLNTSSYKCWCAGWHSHVMTHIDNRVHSQVSRHNWGKLLCCPGRLLSSLFCIYIETGSWFQCIGTHCTYLIFVWMCSNVQSVLSRSWSQQALIWPGVKSTTSAVYAMGNHLCQAQRGFLSSLGFSQMHRSC